MNTYLKEETLVKIWKECDKEKNEPSEKFLNYIENFKNDELKGKQSILKYEHQKEIAHKYLSFFKEIYGNNFFLRPKHAPEYRENGFLMAHSLITLDIKQEIKIKDIFPSPKDCPYRFKFEVSC